MDTTTQDLGVRKRASRLQTAEVSLVDQPGNAECLIDIIKGLRAPSKEKVMTEEDITKALEAAETKLNEFSEIVKSKDKEIAELKAENAATVSDLKKQLAGLDPAAAAQDHDQEILKSLKGPERTRFEELLKENAANREKAELADFEKRAGNDLGNYPGTDADKAKVLRMIEKSGAASPVIKTALSMLATGNAALAETLDTLGDDPEQTGTDPDPNTGGRAERFRKRLQQKHANAPKS